MISALKLEAGPLLFWPAQSFDKPMPIPSTATDGEIAQMVQGGHRDAIAELVERYSPRMYRYLIHLLGDASLAEDVLQETWLRVMERIDRYNPNLSFKTWLFTVAHNCAVDALRRRSRQETVVAPLENEEGETLDWDAHLVDEEPSALFHFEENELQARVVRLFSRLPRHYREVLALRFHEEMPLEEIARVLRIPLSTAKTRIKRGIEILRQRLLAWEKK
jgi:RNA polymerase sigma-70 factor (ECF subfamily)